MSYSDVKDLSNEQIQEELAKLRELKDATIKRLKALVAEHDDRIALAKLKETHPRLAQRIENAGGIASGEQVNTPSGGKA